MCSVLFISLQVYIIDAINPQSGIQRFRKRVSGIQYFLEHHHGLFYVLTNAPISKDESSVNGNYYLATCRVEDLQSNDFQVILSLLMYNQH
jgi:protease II